MVSTRGGKTRLRVAFDATPIFKDERGIGRYARELLKAMSRLCDICPYYARSRSPTKREWYEHQFSNLVAVDPRGTETDHHGGGRRFRGLWWRQNDADVVFFPSIHWAPPKLPDNSIVVIHDVLPLIFPDLLPKPAEEWRSRYRRVAHKARVIVTVSESSAEDVSKYLQIPPRRIFVIHNGVTTLPVDEAYPIPAEPYFVSMGAADRHKNVETVIEAMKLLGEPRIKLYVTGREDLVDYARRQRVKDRVIFTGRVSDAVMGSLIKGAVGFVFPSLYEGFGLPPLEAGALGCPVISSFRPAMSTLLRGAAVFVEAKDHVGWARAMETLAAEPAKRAEMGARARELAERYSWQDAAGKFVALFARVAGKQEP